MGGESRTAVPSPGAASRVQVRRGGHLPRPGRGDAQRRDRSTDHRSGGPRRRLPGTVRRGRRVAGGPASPPGRNGAPGGGGERRGRFPPGGPAGWGPPPGGGGGGAPPP